MGDLETVSLIANESLPFQTRITNTHTSQHSLLYVNYEVPRKKKLLLLLHRCLEEEHPARFLMQTRVEGTVNTFYSLLKIWEKHLEKISNIRYTRTHCRDDMKTISIKILYL